MLANKTMLDGPAIIAALSSPFEDEQSFDTALSLARRPDLAALIANLYPRLARERTVNQALKHLERAGVDLEAVHIPSEVFVSSYPLNRVLPDPKQGTVALAWIQDGLHRHQALILGLISDLSRLAAPGLLILGKGQAYRARYPGYARFCGDVEVFLPEVGDVLRVVDGLTSELGFAMHTCKVGGVVKLKVFRMADGHELNVAMHAGGFPSAFLAVPFDIGFADPDRAWPARVGDTDVLVWSPEDLLLGAVVKSLRDGFAMGRSLNDGRFVLVSDAETLDWDYLVRTSRRNAIAGALWWTVRSAERVEGRSLAPRSAVAALRPGSLQRRLFAVQPSRVVPVSGERSKLSARREWAAGKLSAWLWELGYVRARVGPVRGPALAFLDRTQIRIYRREIRLWRRADPISTMTASVLHRLRPWFHSLCEVRPQAPPEVLGFCLGRVPRAARSVARGVDAELVRYLPDQGQERFLPKRAITGLVAAQPHRCEYFLVNSARRR